MIAVATIRYVYVPSHWPEEEQRVALCAYETAGYDIRHVCGARSVVQAGSELPEGATLVVYTLGLFGSLDELLEVLARLAERRILLRSLREPWTNEAIQEHAYCVEKLRNTLHKVSMR